MKLYVYFIYQYPLILFLILLFLSIIPTLSHQQINSLFFSSTQQTDQIISTFSSQQLPTNVSNFPPLLDSNTTYEILKEFYYTTNGPQWNVKCRNITQEKTCWLAPNSSYCTWYGIYCDSTKTQVQILMLENNNLQGMIPNSLGRLVSLINLDLRDNFLFGNFPQIMNLTLLASLRLNGNLLGGTLPDWIGRLTQLTWLDLRENAFMGPIPESLGNLTKLTALRLNSNNLTGCIPETLGNLVQIAELDLSSNSLSCQIPSSLGNLKNLLYLTLSQNSLTGSIPDSINTNTSSLTKIILSDNQLSGPIPVLRLSNLVTLSLDNNHFSGAIPNEIYGYLPYISGINLANNHLTGELSSDLSNLAIGSALAYFSVEGNELMHSPTNGTFPSWLEADYSNLNLQDKRIFYCASVRLKKAGLLEIHISPSYFDYSHCDCSAGYYGRPPNNCKPCPINCNCTTGRDTLSWSKGFYPIISYDHHKRDILGAEKCLEETACNPYGNCTASWVTGILPNCILCAPQHSGRLCSKCACSDVENCYFSNGVECLACEKMTAVIFVPIVAFIAILICLFPFLFWFLQRTKSHLIGHVKFRWEVVIESVKSGHVKTLLVYLQTVNSLGSLWKNPWVLHFVRFLSFSNVKTSGLGLVCFIPDLNDPVTDLIFSLSIPGIFLILIIILVLILMIGNFICNALKRSRRESELEGLLNESKTPSVPPFKPTPLLFGVYLSMSVLYLLYFELANRVFEVFNCVKEDQTNKKYMQNLPWLECSSKTEWGELKNIALIFIFIYVIGIPLFFSILLLKFRHRTRTDPKTKYWLGRTITGSYRPEFYWFEMVLILRRLALAALISLVPVGSPFQASGVFFVLVASLACQYYLQPYSTPSENVVEEIGLISLLLTYGIQKSVQIENSQSQDTSIQMLVVITLVFHILVILTMIVFLFRRAWLIRQKKKQMEAEENE